MGPPYQDVDLLIKLRNALIHYEPESIISISDIPDKPVTEHKFEKRLQYKFKLNPLTGPGNPFYPDKVLGHGCCEWAIKNCISFTDEFFERIDAKPTYEHVKDRLSTVRNK